MGRNLACWILDVRWGATCLLRRSGILPWASRCRGIWKEWSSKSVLLRDAVRWLPGSIECTCDGVNIANDEPKKAQRQIGTSRSTHWTLDTRGNNLDPNQISHKVSNHNCKEERKVISSPCLFILERHWALEVVLAMTICGDSLQFKALHKMWTTQYNLPVALSSCYPYQEEYPSSNS